MFDKEQQFRFLVFACDLDQILFKYTIDIIPVDMIGRHAKHVWLYCDEESVATVLNHKMDFFGVTNVEMSSVFLRRQF